MLGEAVVVLVVCGINVTAASASETDPSFLHGLGKTIAGIIFELPRTVVDATLTGPPVAGTVVGLMAGTVKALQTTAAGLAEMAAGFDPWGDKKRRRR